MRKLSPALIMAALVSSAAFANTDKMSNTTTSTDANASTTTSPTVAPNTKNPAGLSYSDKSNTSTGTNAKMNGETGTTTAAVDDTNKAKKKAKKKVAKNDMKAKPVDSTNGAAAESTTGKSTGGS
jgi:hypothetical protein